MAIQKLDRMLATPTVRKAGGLGYAAPKQDNTLAKVSGQLLDAGVAVMKADAKMLALEKSEDASLTPAVKEALGRFQRDVNGRLYAAGGILDKDARTILGKDNGRAFTVDGVAQIDALRLDVENTLPEADRASFRQRSIAAYNSATGALDHATGNAAEWVRNDRAQTQKQLAAKAEQERAQREREVQSADDTLRYGALSQQFSDMQFGQGGVFTQTADDIMQWTSTDKTGDSWVQAKIKEGRKAMYEQVAKLPEADRARAIAQLNPLFNSYAESVYRHYASVTGTQRSNLERAGFNVRVTEHVNAFNRGADDFMQGDNGSGYLYTGDAGATTADGEAGYVDAGVKRLVEIRDEVLGKIADNPVLRAEVQQKLDAQIDRHRHLLQSRQEAGLTARGTRVNDDAISGYVHQFSTGAMSLFDAKDNITLAVQNKRELQGLDNDSENGIAATQAEVQRALSPAVGDLVSVYLTRSQPDTAGARAVLAEAQDAGMITNRDAAVVAGAIERTEMTVEVHQHTMTAAENAFDKTGNPTVDDIVKEYKAINPEASAEQVRLARIDAKQSIAVLTAQKDAERKDILSKAFAGIDETGHVPPTIDVRDLNEFQRKNLDAYEDWKYFGRGVPRNNPALIGEFYRDPKKVARMSDPDFESLRGQFDDQTMTWLRNWRASLANLTDSEISNLGQSVSFVKDAYEARLHKMGATKGTKAADKLRYGIQMDFLTRLARRTEVQNGHPLTADEADSLVKNSIGTTMVADGWIWDSEKPAADMKWSDFDGAVQKVAKAVLKTQGIEPNDSPDTEKLYTLYSIMWDPGFRASALSDYIGPGAAETFEDNYAAWRKKDMSSRPPLGSLKPEEVLRLYIINKQSGDF